MKPTQSKLDDETRHALFGDFGEPDETPVPIVNPKRLDMTRMVHYAHTTEERARAEFKKKYWVEAEVAVFRQGYGWTLGPIPEDWSPPDVEL